MTLRRVFQILAVGFAASAVFHVVAAAGSGPIWRHLLFVGINAANAVLVLRRPVWYPYLFAILFGQQIVSHGTYLVARWQAAHRIDWPSVVVLVSMPVTMLLLVVDRRRRRQSLPGAPDAAS